MKRSIRNILLIVGSVLLSFTTLELEQSKPSAVIPFNHNGFYTTDVLGNLFVVKEDNSVLKFSHDGELKTSINNKLLGNLHYVDASNPFELYLYYKDQNKVVYTDNMLSYRGETDLNNLELANVSCIARSYDNNLWIWDQNDLQLKKVSKDLKVLAASGNSRMWTSGDFDPVQMIDNENQVFLYDPNQGVFVFDAFANFYKRIPLVDVKQIQVTKNEIWTFDQNILKAYNLKRLNWVNVDTIEANSVRVEPDHTFVQKNDSIYIYVFND